MIVCCSKCWLPKRCSGACCCWR